jgi:hypothetical protein
MTQHNDMQKAVHVTAAERVKLLAVRERFDSCIGHDTNAEQTLDALDTMRENPTRNAEDIVGPLVDGYLDAEADLR